MPSAASPPFSRLGISAARTGTRLPSGIPAGQRLVEDARAVLVLGADREMRIEQRRALPPQHLERAAAAALGRLVLELRLRLRHAAEVEHLARHRRGQPERHHLVHEGAAGELADLHLCDQTAQCLLVHARYSSRLGSVRVRMLRRREPPQGRLRSNRTGLRDMVNAPDPARCRGEAGCRAAALGKLPPRAARRSGARRRSVLASLPHTVSSVHPSAANSEARSGASATEKNSSSCGGFTRVPASMAWAWPR